MKNPLSYLWMSLCFIAGCALSLGVCLYVYTRYQPKEETTSPALEKAEEVYEVLNTMYIGEIDEELMCDTIAEAMVYATNDRWSYYIPAEDYQTHMDQMNNSYVGIGVTVQQTEDNRFVVTEVVPDGPADEAGVLPEDEFAKIEDTSCEGLNLTELRNLVKGEVGTEVQITFLRDGKELTLTMERRRVETEVVSYEKMGDVGYVAIYNFDATAGEKTIAAVKDLQEQGVTSLLFDVRYNPGGYKAELLEVLDYLLPAGPLFQSKDFLGNQDVDASDASCVDLPMVVLINQDSYSAAEFFAAALSEYGVAKTVGTQTCGKGYFQVTQPLSDGSALNISIGEYYTPNGVSLAEVGGLVPDEVLELDEEDAKLLASRKLAPEEDEQLQKALSLLK